MSSDNYASRLSEYKNKGICGLPEKSETKRSLDSKINKLISLIENAKHIAVLTGAGISTGAGSE
jgi:mono-ADP-ribosyltransferase sirtuin 6